MNWKEELKCPCCDYDIGMDISYDESNEYEEWYCLREDIVNEPEGYLYLCGWSESIWIRDISHLLED